MTREQAALLRLLLICLAWAVGDLVVASARVPLADLVLPLALAIGVYLVTQDLGRPRLGGGDTKYWRGRRIDEDERRRGRWN